MNLLSTNATNTFNLLSIGQRGVGKTVFLAGSYLELQADLLEKPAQQLWFDCQDDQAQENIERILNYIVKIRQYPPPTMKVTSFSFELKRQSLRGTETISRFHWSDIPGEICTVHNLDFRRMVSGSHGCCVFIDACALSINSSYLEEIEEVIRQVTAIATLAHLNGLKYSFALILTKCDLVEAESFNQQRFQESLQPLTTRLDAVKASYQTFYSFIPLVHTASTTTLKAEGAAAPFLWLVCELSKAHTPHLTNSLLDFVTSRRSGGSQPQPQVVNGLGQSLLSSTRKSSKGKKLLGLTFYPHNRKYILPLALVSVSLAVVVGFFLMNHQQTLQSKSTVLATLDNIATLRQRGQYSQAIPLMEKLVQQQPELVDLHLQLAYLYEITGQLAKAEAAYDQVLTQQKNNLKALVHKAIVRKAQGDTKTAADLFLQAEKAAPADFKAQIRALAQEQPQPQNSKN